MRASGQGRGGGEVGDKARARAHKGPDVKVVVYPAADEEEGEAEYGLETELPPEDATEAQAEGKASEKRPAMQAVATKVKRTHQRLKVVCRRMGRLNVGNPEQRDSRSRRRTAGAR